MNGREIEIFPSIEELNNFALEQIVRLSAEAIGKRGIFTIALSGGSTPRKLYEMLAQESLQGLINWHQVHFFFGDERHVPRDSEESNFRMANEALFSKIAVPHQNIHRFQTEESNAEIVAEKMENELREFFGLAENEFPHFDLILLGMGTDGHTASLFPGTSSLKETKRLVAENYVEKFQTFRFTFSVPTINHARDIIFLIAGEDKADVLRETLEGEDNFENFPARLINPLEGTLQFLIDKKAASKLELSL
jgi:6-phosphogluconolactonase